MNDDNGLRVVARLPHNRVIARCDSSPPLTLTREERRLIEALRSHPWGEATVILKGGQPVMLKGVREDVKLTDG
jgi:hypothetical protein